MTTLSLRKRLKKYKGDWPLALIPPAAVVMGYLVALGQGELAVLVLFALLVPVLLSAEKAGMYILVTAVLVQLDYLGRFWFDVPAVLGWLPHLVALLLLFHRLYARHRPQTRLPRGSLAILSALGAITVISAIFNATSPLVMLVGLLQFFPLISCFVLVSFTDRQTKEQLLSYVLSIGMAQLPVVLLQRLVFFQGPDSVTGTFSITVITAAFMVFCILYVVHRWFAGRITTPGFMVRTIPFLLTLSLSNASAAWIYLLIGFVWLFLQFLIERRKLNLKFQRGFLALLLLLPLFIGFILLYDEIFERVYGYRILERMTDPEFVWEYGFGDVDPQSQYTKGGAYRRGAAVAFVFNLIRQSPLTTLFGLGPGNVSESAIGAAEGYYAKLYRGLEVGRNSLSTVLGEFGILGVGVVVLIWLRLYVPDSRGVRAQKPAVSQYDLKLLRATLIVFGGMLIYYNVLRDFTVPLIIALLYGLVMERRP